MVEWMVENIDKAITIWAVVMAVTTVYAIKTIIDIWRNK